MACSSLSPLSPLSSLSRASISSDPTSQQSPFPNSTHSYSTNFLSLRLVKKFSPLSSFMSSSQTPSNSLQCKSYPSGVEEIDKEDEISTEELNGAATHDDDSIINSNEIIKGVSNALVGVLGGGQLGRMLCQAASPLGIKIAILDPISDAPAGPLAYRHVIGSFRDSDSVEELSKGCEVVTVEIEHVDVEALESISEKGIRVEPSPKALRIIQDKYQQKIHFQNHGILLPEFDEVNDMEGLIQIANQFQYPFVLKARKLAYDGRGNYLVKNEMQLEEAVNTLGGFERGLYAEKFVPFIKELAVMVARCQNGTVSSFPVVETIHKDNICHTVEAPAQISARVRDSAARLAESAISSLGGAGIFGVELFLLPDETVLLNEIAPRPHNSGHYTIESCHVSQYEQHLRAVLGLPLGDPSMKVKAAAMVNILGEDEGENGFRIANEMIERALQVKGASVHWYEKPEIRSQRKMGHITVVGRNAQDVRSKIKFISQALYSNDVDEESPNEVLVGIVMGSDSDLPIMKDAAQVLSDFNIPHEVTVVSAHRTPERMFEYAKNAHYRGIRVIIAGAGGAAHLPGMVASLTPLPVIGVPVKSSSLSGLDSLLSIVQMPKGVPVSTVAINNATNAGLLAVRQLAAHDSFLMKKLMVYQEEMRLSVIEKAEHLEEVGWANYLDEK